MEDFIVNVSSLIKYNCEPTGLGHNMIMYKSNKKSNKTANEILASQAVGFRDVVLPSSKNDCVGG